MVDVKQSLYICGALAALGGLLEVLATAVLAYPAARMQQGVKWSEFCLRMALFLNIILQLLASIAGNLCSTWFGPISIAGPVFFAAQLVSNLIIFWIVLGIENFTREMQVGTYVIVVSVTLLLQVGPGTQEHQDFERLITEPWAAIWCIVSLGAMIITAIPLLPCFDLLALPMWKRFFILLVVRASAFSINLTTGRAVILDINNEWIIASVIIKVLSGAIYTRAIVVQSTVVEQARFVPLNAVFTLFVVGWTGIIVWEDWRVVNDWTSYGCVFLLFVLGSYLLLGGDIGLLSEADPRAFRSTYALAHTSGGTGGTRDLFDSMNNISVSDEFALSEIDSEILIVNKTSEVEKNDEEDPPPAKPVIDRRALLQQTKSTTNSIDPPAEAETADRRELMMKSKQSNTRNLMKEEPEEDKNFIKHRPWSSLRNLTNDLPQGLNTQTTHVRRHHHHHHNQNHHHNHHMMTKEEAWKNLYTRPAPPPPSMDNSPLVRSPIISRPRNPRDRRMTMAFMPRQQLDPLEVTEDSDSDNIATNPIIANNPLLAHLRDRRRSTMSFVSSRQPDAPEATEDSDNDNKAKNPIIANNPLLAHLRDRRRSTMSFVSNRQPDASEVTEDSDNDNKAKNPIIANNPLLAHIRERRSTMSFISRKQQDTTEDSDGGNVTKKPTSNDEEAQQSHAFDNHFSSPLALFRPRNRQSTEDTINKSFPPRRRLSMPHSLMWNDSQPAARGNNSLSAEIRNILIPSFRENDTISSSMKKAPLSPRSGNDPTPSFRGHDSIRSVKTNGSLPSVAESDRSGSSEQLYNIEDLAAYLNDDMISDDEVTPPDSLEGEECQKENTTLSPTRGDYLPSSFRGMDSMTSMTSIKGNGSLPSVIENRRRSSSTHDYKGVDFRAYLGDDMISEEMMPSDQLEGEEEYQTETTTARINTSNMLASKEAVLEEMVSSYEKRPEESSDHKHFNKNNESDEEVEGQIYVEIQSRRPYPGYSLDDSSTVDA